MEDEENDDYNNYDDYDAENENDNGGDDDMKDELENLFLNAGSAEDPISAYKNVIELEASNSDDKSMTIRSYKEICIIYLLRDDYENFGVEINNLMLASKSLKEELYKTKLFDEILRKIKENMELDFSNYLKKMISVSDSYGYLGLSNEIKNFLEQNEKYSKLIEKDKNKFAFSNLINEYNKIKERCAKNIYTLDNLTEKEKLFPKYESMTVNKQIPIIKQSLNTWKFKDAKKFWSEWVEDYERFSDLPIFYSNWF